MTDAPRPFRPRAPGPELRSADSVREQMARVRRRANARAAQSALYVTLSTALMAGSALIVLAFALSRIPYAITVWVAFAVTLLLWHRSVVAARGAWIRRSRAAASIDGRAGLEERLTTFAARESCGSRLWPLLLEQNLRLLPRWTPKTLVPRVVPRSIWMLAIAAGVSLACLLWSGILDSDRSIGGEQARADAPANADESGGEGEELASGADGEGESSLAELLTSIPDALRERILGSGDAKNADQATIAVAKRGDSPSGSGAIRPGEANSPPPGGTAPTMRGLTGKDAKPVGGPTDPRNASRSEIGKGAPPANMKPPAKGDHAKTLQRVEAGRPRPSKQDAPSEQAKGGGGRGASGGTGGDGEGLFGPAEAGRKAQAVFELDLAGESAEGAGPDRDGSLAAPPSTSLAAEQRLDDAIRRAQVPAEYEPIVQRFFRRGESEEAAVGTR